MFRSDIESYSTYPILGELVEEKVPHPLVTGTNDRSFVIEQFRQIRTVLKHQGNPPGNIKRISITSAIKGDGKSFVSGNLAMSFARSGKKVALLELDLHQPKISEMFGIPPTIGLTEYLDNAARVENIIYKSNKNENLFIIPSGYPHDDASELLQNEKLEKLLEHLDKVFDIIIMDTVPYKALTDAFSIGAKANIVLVVIRHNHTPVKIIERIHEDMEAQKIEQVALIFNGVKKRGMGQYSYGYGYGYGYDQKSKYDEYNKGRVKKIS
jgi:capsular exopolysaccharide synthesis family protein